MKPVLGYWECRGRAHPLRLLLHYAGVDFVDKRYTDFQEWFQKDKIDFQGTLDFPNLPYYIDGDIKITQSQAIHEHLGRKHNLNGKSEAELVRMKLIDEQVAELMVAITKMAYPPNVTNKTEIFDLLRKEYVSALNERLGAISKFLGANEWITGSRLTYVDFNVYKILDIQRCLFNPKHLNEFPNLVAYLKRFENLKGVKEYLESDQVKSMAIFGKFASLGNTVDYKPTD